MTRARNIAKLVSEQISGNVNVSGIITAATFFGEGSGITGVSPVGSGVTILDGGVSKGSASKIDFADHFTVSSISSGIATITVGVTTEYIASNQINNAGVVTTGSAIVGTAVTINSSGIDVTGVVTATTFSGSITGTTGTASTASFATTSFGLAGTPNLNVGVVTASSFVGNLTGNATNLSGAPNIIVNNISAASGIATFEDVNAEGNIRLVGYTTISAGGINVTGIITATSFRGDGTQLTGIGTADVRTSTLVVTGVSTFSGVATHTQSVFGTNLNLSGVATASSFVGNLTGNATGLSGNPNISVNNINASSGIGTFEDLDVEGRFRLVGFATISTGGLNAVGIVTASQGFVSSANTSPVQIRLVGNQLTFNVVGIGSTTLTLA